MYTIVLQWEVSLDCSVQMRTFDFVIAGHCRGLQACQAVAEGSSFGEPCPGLGSYLSVEYHCKDGMIL